MNKNRKHTRAGEARSIVQGRPIKICCLVHGHDDQVFVLMKWTTGDCYVPYELAKRHFNHLLFRFLTSKPVGL